MTSSLLNSNLSYYATCLPIISTLYFDMNSKFPICEAFRIYHFTRDSLQEPYTISTSIAGITDCSFTVTIEHLAEGGNAHMSMELGHSTEIRKLRVHFLFQTINTNNRKRCFYEDDRIVKPGCVLRSKEFISSDHTEKENDEDPYSVTFCFEVYVKAIQGMDRIWKFNFYDRIYGDVEETRPRMVHFLLNDDDSDVVDLYCPKQQLKFYSPYFADIPDDEGCGTGLTRKMDRSLIEKVLQIAHGVREELSSATLCQLLRAASLLDMKDVIRYCQSQIIMSPDTPLMDEFEFRIAAYFNDHIYMAHWLGNLNSNDELKKILKTLDLQRMTSESMKQCVKFFLKN
ncbi:hypothetical protein GCK72_021641 [Caenorhabditis remanei]|uniref:BTB domain-containing protein n=1 Tax=Caenorhabditis remanei TaxID=31234 RepID=A0A6A5GK96_CAERE|nr:hypothetical protein GCK72_021641 [Caenorhabditis remanei]KAF1755073.1 hypothetical protein GCK72_021641 [Caenorhabditis remanei]